MRSGNIFIKIATTLIVIFVVGYIAFQVIRPLYNPIKTTPAVLVSTRDSILLRGMLVRDEKPLVMQVGGAVDILVSEGERVSKGEDLGYIYRDMNAVNAKRKADILDDKIALLNQVYNQGEQTLELEIINNAVNEKIISMAAASDKKNIDLVSDDLSDIKVKTLTREFIFSDRKLLLQQINELKAQKKEIELKQPKGRITAPMPGYFSFSYDGGEKIINRQTMLTMDDAAFQNIVENLPKQMEEEKTHLGKIVSDYVFSYVAVIDQEAAEKIGERTKVKLFFDNALPTPSGQIIRFDKCKSGKYFLVIDCHNYLASFTSKRAMDAELVLYEYQGLKVPKIAMRVNEDGVEGVYTLSNDMVKFKPVEMILEKEDYYVVKYDPDRTDSLLLHDRIVVKGK